MKEDKDILKVEEDILSGLDRLDVLLDEYEKLTDPRKKAMKLTNKKIAFVGSIGQNNAPNIKAMLVAKRDGLNTFYFASNNSAMRTEQFKINGKACIYFYGKPIYEGLMLEGTMEVINDENIKKLIWKNGMKNAYKNGGINDPDYCVLKFIAKSGRYYTWFKTETFEI
jgi:general stress protein 26